MGTFNCENCGVRENTALGLFWSKDLDIWPETIRGKKLCSECAPAKFIDGSRTKFGKWHGQFEKNYEPLSNAEAQALRSRSEAEAEQSPGAPC